MNSRLKSTGFKVIGALAMAVVLNACGGPEDIRDSISMDYLNAKTGKPIVYPAGVDAPKASDAFAIPPVSAGNQSANADINELVRPPSLLPPEQPATADKGDGDDKTVMANVGAESESEDN